MSDSQRRRISTVVVAVLVVNAVCRSVQIVQSLMHLWPYTQVLATQGMSTSQALAQSHWMMASNILGLLTWWALALLAWLVRSEALRRPTATG